MDMREKFETWIDDYGWSIQPDSTGLVGRYEDDRTQLAWEAWQESRKSLAIQQFRGYKFEGCQYYDADSVDDALTDSGVNRK